MTEVIPPRTRHLGSRLLAFVLDISNERACDLLSGAATLAPREETAIVKLEAALDKVAEGRVSNKVLEFYDAMSLASNRNPEGQNLFTQIRQMSGAGRSPISGTDEVEAALSKICFECFPFTLLPSDHWEISRGQPQLPTIFNTQLLSEFMTAVRADRSLMRLFPEGASDDLAASTMIFTSFGNGSSVQICLLHERVIQAAIALMRIRKQYGVADLQAAAIEMLNAVRKIAEGEDVDLPVVDTFDLVGLPDEFEIPAGDGRLRCIPRDFIRSIPLEARPATNSEKDIFGCMLVREAKFSAFLSSAGFSARTG